MPTTSSPTPGGPYGPAVDELRALVRGVVLAPADSACAEVQAEQVQAAHDGAVIVQAASTADVLATIGVARRHSIGIDVRAGDHPTVDRSAGCAVVLDLSAMRGVAVDPLDRTAVVAGGATWADVDGATQPHGLAVPGGRISSTGVAALTLRGGDGWLSGRHGLSCDNLIEVELVTADGRVVAVDERREPDLFWALRGGGGNVGVVTSLTFRLHPIEPLVLGGLLAYPLAAAPRVLALLGELVEESGGDLGGAAAFLHAPPAPYVPGDVVGRPVLGVVPAYFGDPGAGQELLRPLREKVLPLIDAVGPVPYVALQRQLDSGNPPGMRNRCSSGSVPELTGPLVSDLQDAAARMPGPLSAIVVAPLGPAVREATADDTALPAGARGRWLIHAMARWRDPGGDAEAARWVDGIVAATRTTGAPGRDLDLAGSARHRRLQEVEAAWDPDDVFGRSTPAAACRRMTVRTDPLEKECST